MQHRVWAEIHASAAKHNLAAVKKLTPSAKLMAVLKADAYGHGQQFMANTFDNGIDAIAIATIEEGVRLRELGCIQPIVCLSGLIDPTQLALCTLHNITPTFYQPEQLQWLAAYEGEIKDSWVKINTGMNRLGFEIDQVDAVVKQVTASCSGTVGIMSHFANADTPDDPHNDYQISRFTSAIKPFSDAAFSMANSAAVLKLPHSHYDWVRPGVVLYGASPFAEHTAGDLGLRAVMYLKSSLISCYSISEDDRVGYGGIWAAKDTTRIGVVSAGYADGYPRNVSDEAYVLINQQSAPIIGRVSMDTLAVDLSSLDDCKTGDDVELWGEQLSVDTVAKWAGTIGYELLCKVGQRVARINID
ncbi:MAG: alanine racemase [Saprospiraceae bacterium]|jgi:alanine racemase